MTKFSNSVVTDLTVCVSPPTFSPSTVKLDPRKWRRIEKDLYQYTAQQSAWLYVALANEQELTTKDMVVIDISVGEPTFSNNASTGLSWESRPCGIWVLRRLFSGEIDPVVTEVDVLFGIDAVDPRPQWTLMRSPLTLDIQPNVPVARLTKLHGRTEPKSDPVLRVNEDGKFRIVQISDAHMVTGVGVCLDASDGNGRHLPTSEADPLTVKFIREILDLEKPDLVILTGDQLHHDISDSQTALFKTVAPLIQRQIPFAAIFGNHDSEGTHVLSRKAQMSILQNLPFSLCEPGPEQVDGVGNFYLQVLGPESSQLSVLTIYLLDSHGLLASHSKIWGMDKLWSNVLKRNYYEHIKQSQIDWFIDTSQELRRKRVEEVANDNRFHQSLAFQHIPLLEFGDRNLCIYKGLRREPTEGPWFNSHFYDALASEKVLALGCGHDHVNDYCGRLNQTGPWLCYAGVVGFGGYSSYDGVRYHRRARVWDLCTSSESLRTWKRVEYAKDRLDELELLGSGVVTETPVKKREEEAM